MGYSAGDAANWIAEELGSDYDNLSREQQEARVQRASDRLNRAIWLAEGGYDADTPEGADLRSSARRHGLVAPDGSLKSSMTLAESMALREWALDAVGNDNHQGPIYDDHGEIGTGVNDVHEGEVDVNDRR